MPKQNQNASQFAGPYLRWQRQYGSPELSRQAESLSVRRDMITLLTFVRDHKVVGTQSTGNMPLKAVRAVTARFVNPPELDQTIGERTYRLRTETEVWPLYFLHILAEVGRLLNVAPARRWRLTSMGENFLNAPALLQVSFLLAVWWHEVNWLVAYPVTGMGEALPPFFNVSTLGHLQESCAVGQPVSFEKFADGLIEKTGLVWTAPDSSFARMSLHSSIKQMVIDVLVTFGGVECEYQEKPLGQWTTLELDTFELTPLGRALLDAVAIVIG